MNSHKSLVSIVAVGSGAWPVRLRISALTVLVVSLLGLHGTGFLTAASPAPDRLVAEGMLQDGYLFLPVVLHGRAMSVILDLGSSYGLVPVEDQLGEAFLNDHDLDSLSLGTTVEHHIALHLIPGFNLHAPPGLPSLAGVLGTPVLSHYDLVLESRARRVRLYAPPPSLHRPAAPVGTRVPWLPPGLTPTDCTGMLPFAHDTTMVGIGLRANGSRMPSYFDSGADQTKMNPAAADALGLFPDSPNVSPLADSLRARTYSDGSGGAWFQVTGVRLTIGIHHLDGPIQMATGIPVGLPPDTPVLALGLNAFRDRILLVSYSTRQVCLSGPR